ncbi:MAG: ketoacyl-ACP synthase III [Gemmatimonadetes bacterium]|nr:ketoacyl-ACP synthase III [Gemmatimonadota bacterium]MBT5055775.1 ketoacyl-ACP synthase III [Gemmatimonadota bacterium]MBT5141742.1 ketoacyl-ACP synthase III [Gemmatimonadota bacterium]MBT5591045.1 ketoacyl-ACP synthase III [Gemmatimonadota bacterium]MBT5962889.1 ketoacyl-ACP synthase III [Gemmatimonadota bacterium]
MASTQPRATITAVERFLPERILSNKDLEKVVDTSDEWIRERTGIAERRILDGEPTSYMATKVAQGLLRRRGCHADDIDLILVATITPDMVLPATACLVQDQIGASKAWAFDLLAACSGFVYALVTGAQFISSGAHKRVMVIGADKMSAITDPHDRSTCILFGDGAGGVLLEAAEDGSGLIDFEMHADGSGRDDLHVRGGGSAYPATHESVDEGLHFIRQEGRTVFKFAVQRMAEVSLSLLQRNELTAQDLDLFVPHQANRRIIDATANRMGLASEQVMTNIEHVANTTAGTVPIALSEALDEGRLKPGNLVQLTAVGGGLTWGSALLRWGNAA